MDDVVPVAASDPVALPVIGVTAGSSVLPRRLGSSTIWEMNVSNGHLAGFSFHPDLHVPQALDVGLLHSIFQVQLASSPSGSIAPPCERLNTDGHFRQLRLAEKARLRLVLNIHCTVATDVHEVEDCHHRPAENRGCDDDFQKCDARAKVRTGRTDHGSPSAVARRSACRTAPVRPRTSTR